MTMKKKILTTSLAASLIMGSVAGLPLSTKGLLDKLGAGVASANPIVDSGIKSKIDPIYAQLTDTEKDALRDARTNLTALTDVSLVSGIKAKIDSTITTEGGSYPQLTSANLLKLLTKSGFVYDENYYAFFFYSTDPEVRPILADLAKLAGVSGITFEDAADFADAVEEALKARLMSKTSIIDLAMLTDIETAKLELKAALATVLDNNSLKLTQVLTGVGLDENVLIDTYTAINNEVDTSDNAAQKALALAYLRTQTIVTPAATTDWKKFNLQLKVGNVIVDGGLIDWDVVGTNVTESNGQLTLSSSVTESTSVNLKVTAKVLNKIVYQNDSLAVSFTKPAPTSDGGSGGGGGGNGGNGGNTGGNNGASSNEVSGPDKAKATEALTKVADKLAELLKDKGNGIAKALEAIQEALRNAATIDLSKSVKVEGDKATLAVDVAKLGDVFKTVKELAATANEKLKAAGSTQAVKVVATLDLGTVNSKNVEIPLTKEILEAAKANGIEALALKVNGVELTLDLDQLGSGTTISIKKQDKSAVPASKLSVASDVYDFTFVSGGADVGNFNKPVEVRLPVTVDGLDSELLVFAKIADGKLIFKGGKYDADKKAFVVANKSFSTYAVVENKVSFNDTDAVKDWAGRQIAVAAAKGILEGREEGQFVPNGKVTRAEFAKLVVKAFGVEDAKATETFADVNTSDWFQPYVAAAAKAGLIEGRSADTFDPNAPITRAELATIASRSLSKLKAYQAVEKTDATLAAFQDAASIQTSLKDGVALAAEQGIVIGEDGGKFNPNNDSTRAQAAVVIYRLLNK